MSPQDLSNDALLIELRALGEEARQRVEDYLERAPHDDAALQEGFYFVMQAQDALRPGWATWKSLYWLHHDLEQLVKERPAQGWNRFLSEHPELTDVEPTRTAGPLEFTDVELVVAVSGALETWNRERPHAQVDGVLSSTVADQLATGHPTPGKRGNPYSTEARSNVGRVAYRLRQLEAQGYVERIGKKWEPARWRLGPRMYEVPEADGQSEVKHA